MWWFSLFISSFNPKTVEHTFSKRVEKSALPSGPSPRWCLTLGPAVAHLHSLRLRLRSTEPRPTGTHRGAGGCGRMARGEPACLGEGYMVYRPQFIRTFPAGWSPKMALVSSG